jgi:hypothetical protein
MELVLLFLEHPPTWISLIYAALTQKSFNKSFITSITNKLNKREREISFLSLLCYLHNYKL